jgi:hypothetical protein
METMERKKKPRSSVDRAVVQSPELTTRGYTGTVCGGHRNVGSHGRAPGHSDPHGRLMLPAN